MEYTRSYQNILDNILNASDRYSRPFRGPEIDAREFDRYGEFGTMSFDYSPKTIVPGIAIEPFFSIVRYTFQPYQKTMVISLYATQSDAVKKRTADSIITTFFKCPRDNMGKLLKVTTHKNEVFYGNSGIILDSRRNILFMSSVEYDFEKHDFTKVILFVNPTVLLKENLITKSLMGKVIPYYMTYSKVLKLGIQGQENRYLPVEVIFRDMSHIIQYPKKPTLDIDEKLNDLLVSLSDEVIDCAACQ